MPATGRFEYKSRTSYDRFLLKEDLPIIEGWSVKDVRDVERRPWKRLGGLGAYIQLYGQEDITGLYVAEIPPRSALNAEKHLYEKTCYILAGEGSTEIKGADGDWRSFGWSEGALFAIPLNFEHRFVNTGNDPALIFAQTNAPIMMDHFHSEDFIFNNPYQFIDRYDGDPKYFEYREQFKPPPPDRGYGYIDTNFIKDVRQAPFIEDAGKWKGEGFNITQHELADNVMVGHYSDFIGGTYNKAHAHGGGAVLLILQGEGYVLMWPYEAGIRPYESGHEGEVVRCDFQQYSIYGPGSGWYHTHTATSDSNVRQLALRYGSCKWVAGFYRIIQGIGGCHASIREGGTVVDFDMEDPQIRKEFKSELEGKGVPYRMDPAEAP